MMKTFGKKDQTVPAQDPCIVRISFIRPSVNMKEHPIHRLPVELLQQVFLLVINDMLDCPSIFSFGDAIISLNINVASPPPTTLNQGQPNELQVNCLLAALRAASFHVPVVIFQTDASLNKVDANVIESLISVVEAAIRGKKNPSKPIRFALKEIAKDSPLQKRSPIPPHTYRSPARRPQHSPRRRPHTTTLSNYRKTLQPTHVPENSEAKSRLAVLSFIQYFEPAQLRVFDLCTGGG
ncbi:uncharacterized protein BJ212DRAFT_1590635 [Suillus subaureus]|uniref:Uncharacterized protein n=1 Tax=Suillus subaureus TaxID=48587 RepID=A0A9P7DY95_9AGAM|nr:uncharacterized protein BJ212DRAFT_1590635 [Suillus subaureus]KAG1806135.1 hypothetical protein BJ212DRAFT_1590635 [Suillus subaureus]